MEFVARFCSCHCPPTLFAFLPGPSRDAQPRQHGCVAVVWGWRSARRWQRGQDELLRPSGRRAQCYTRRVPCPALRRAPSMSNLPPGSRGHIARKPSNSTLTATMATSSAPRPCSPKFALPTKSSPTTRNAPGTMPTRAISCAVEAGRGRRSTTTRATCASPLPTSWRA